MSRAATLGPAALAIFGLVLFWPLLDSSTQWGVYDWDQHLFYYEAARRTVAEYGQIPLWNPWYCGGNPALANPQSPVLSLSFALVLGFGTVVGLKAAAVVHALIGMLGGYGLARNLGADRLGATFGAAIMMGSSVYALHVAVGHSIWFATAYVPWALWAYVRAREAPGYGLAAGAALAAMALHGQLYFVAYTLLALWLWALLDTGARRDTAALQAVAIASAALAALAAVKFIPMRELFAFQDFQLDDRSTSNWRLLGAALLDRDQSLTRSDLIVDQPWGWWEYGAYIGLLPLGFAVIGALGRRPDARSLTVQAFVFLWLSAGWNAGLWPLVQSLPLGAGLRVPSRLILMAVVFLALLGALGLTALREWLAGAGHRRLAVALPVIVVLFVMADLCAVSKVPLALAFTAPAPSVGAPGPFVQVLGTQRYLNRTPYVTMYPYLLENRGVVNCFERFHLPVRAQPSVTATGQLRPEYRGEVYLVGHGTARLAAFAPNTIDVTYDAPHGGVLVLNQNFDPGWRAGPAPVVDHLGLNAVRLAPGRGHVRFQYRPGSAVLGGAISAGGLIVLLAVALRPRRRHSRRTGR